MRRDWIESPITCSQLLDLCKRAQAMCVYIFGGIACLRFACLCGRDLIYNSGSPEGRSSAFNAQHKTLHEQRAFKSQREIFFVNNKDKLKIHEKKDKQIDKQRTDKQKNRKKVCTIHGIYMRW